MSESNKGKSVHGASTKNVLADLLEECKSTNYVSDVIADYRTGYDNYSDTQFYAPYLITLENGEQWILYSTTSMRTDRIKGQQWDAANLKKIVPGIVYAALIYPDGLSEEIIREFKRQQNKYLYKQEFSAIDNILSQHELRLLIENTALKKLNAGQQKDLKGRNFEKEIASILNNATNFIKWKESEDGIEGLHYDFYEYILCMLPIPRQTVISVKATTDIPRLPSRGSPKTDVLIVAVLSNGETQNYTISCKRSNSSGVTVHQYTADSFADVLDKDNINLRTLLREFQANPSLTAFGEENRIKLTQELTPYRKKLALWVLGGYGGKGDPSIQWADYLLVYDDVNIKLYSVEDYYDHLLNNCIYGHFGTIFNWTYPSKQRGKSIQLKCALI